MKEFESEQGVRWRTRFLISGWAASLLFSGPAAGRVLDPGAVSIVRASVAPDGTEADGDSFAASISGDGRYVAFASAAANLAPGDTNGKTDVFLRDLRDRTTIRISAAPDGRPSDDESGSPTLSADGRFVVFESSASNLVPGDTNRRPDIFLYDRRTRRIEAISLNTAGEPGRQDSYDPWLSGDGRYVAFASEADNLAPGDTNGRMDVFVRDRREGKTLRVSLSPGGGQRETDSFSPSISLDGRYISFTALSPGPPSGEGGHRAEVQVYDRKSGRIVPVSLSREGRPGSGHSKAAWINGDGRYIAFQSYADNLIAGDGNGRANIFLRDLEKGNTTLVSAGPGGVPGNGDSFFPSIDAGGRFIAFYSSASNLVDGDRNRLADVFVRDLRSERTVRVSVGLSGEEADGWSFSPALSADGRSVVFLSAATRLVPEDRNGRVDVFVAGIGFE